MNYPTKLAKKFVLSSVAVAVLTACGGSDKKEEIVVPPVATAPVAQNDTAVSLNDAVIEIDVLANDMAGSGGALSLTSVTVPTQGQASIVNNKISYTPADTFLGTDNFSYTVSSGSLNATALVTVSGHQSLTLSGRVIDSPIADATIQVIINDETYTATADSQGFYQLSVLLTTVLSDELIRITAQGAEANQQGYVTLSSLTETATQLLALRKDDLSIEREQLAAVQLTQLTTAKDLLIQQIAGDNMLTAEQLAEAEISLDVEKLLSVAAAIKLLVDDPSFTLPEGYATIEQFVMDETAFAAFIATASEGENSPLSQAITETLADPEITPSVKPLSGNYLRTMNGPSFIVTSTSDSLRFDNETVEYISLDNSTGEVKSGKKSVEINGSSIMLIDPDQSGFLRTTSFQVISSDSRYFPNESVLAAWQANGCPSQIEVTISSGYTKLSVVEQTEHQFIAQVETYSRNEPSIDSECAGIMPQTVTDSGSFTAKYIKESSAINENFEFDLSQKKQWILPDFSGHQFSNDLFTLRDDGTVETLTGIYDGFMLSWSLSDDKKTLTLKKAHPDDSGEFKQMDLHINRTSDSVLSVVATFIKNESDERFSALRPIMPVMGDGIVDKFEATAGTNKMIALSFAVFSSSDKEWQGRERLPGNWFGWKLEDNGESRNPVFSCDGNEMTNSGDICLGHFRQTGQFVSRGPWQIVNNALHIVQNNIFLRVITPLYEHEGVIVGYEYMKYVSTEIDGYAIKPRVMYWTLEELPPLD